MATPGQLKAAGGYGYEGANYWVDQAFNDEMSVVVDDNGTYGGMMERGGDYALSVYAVCVGK